MQPTAKKDFLPRGLDFLENVCDAVEIPVYAIGGINIASSDDSTASDAPPLMMLCQTLVFRDLLMLWNVEPPEDVLCRG